MFSSMCEQCRKNLRAFTMLSLHYFLHNAHWIEWLGNLRVRTIRFSIRSFARTAHSVAMLGTARFARSLCFAHSFARSLTSSALELTRKRFLPTNWMRQSHFLSTHSELFIRIGLIYDFYSLTLNFSRDCRIVLKVTALVNDAANSLPTWHLQETGCCWHGLCLFIVLTALCLMLILDRKRGRCRHGLCLFIVHTHLCLSWTGNGDSVDTDCVRS